eukprot:4222009-Prymnesium_polylepis.2
MRCALVAFVDLTHTILMVATLTRAFSHLTSRIQKVLDSNDTSVPFGKGSGYVVYKPTGERSRFPADRCAPWPRETLLEERWAPFPSHPFTLAWRDGGARHTPSAFTLACRHTPSAFTRYPSPSPKPSP